MNNTSERLIRLAEVNIESKRNEELERLEQSLKHDKEVIEKVLKLIDDHLLYKVISQYGCPVQYQLVTPEIFEADYLKTPDHDWCQGLVIKDSNKNYGATVEVNGESYYDIRYALNKFSADVEKREQTLSTIQQKLIDIKCEIEFLYKSLPALKAAITEWQEHQNKETEHE